MGYKVKEARLKKKISTAELAMAIGCSQGHISNVESGAAALTLDKLLAIAKVLAIPIPWLLPSADEYDPPIVDYKHSRAERLEIKIQELQQELEQLKKEGYNNGKRQRTTTIQR